MKEIKHITLHPTAKTHIARERMASSTLMDQVCAVLGWSPMRYCEHQYQNYEDFIARLFPGKPEQAKTVRYSALFRGFWIIEWDRRNRSFLSIALELMDTVFDFDSNGRFTVTEGLEPGDLVVLDEYLYRHNIYTLYADADFRVLMEETIRLIKKIGR